MGLPATFPRRLSKAMFSAHLAAMSPGKGGEIIHAAVHISEEAADVSTRWKIPTVAGFSITPDGGGFPDTGSPVRGRQFDHHDFKQIGAPRRWSTCWRVATVPARISASCTDTKPNFSPMQRNRFGTHVCPHCSPLKSLCRPG